MPKKRQSPKKTTGWDGTPPVRTYPYVIRTSNAIWGEPGISLWVTPDDFYSSEWTRDTPTLRVKRLVERGDPSYSWVPGYRPDPNRKKDRWEVVKEWTLPTELLAGPTDDQYLWVHRTLDDYVRTEHGVEIVKP